MDGKQASFSTAKDLRNVSYQRLGSYFLFNQLPAEDKAVLGQMMAEQTAMFTLMTEAFEREYQRCVNDEGEVVEEPNLDHLMEWRKKMQETYDFNKMALDNYIENVSVKAKKKLKKKYSKLKGGKGLMEGSENIETEAVLKQIDAILRDRDEKVDIDDNGVGMDSEDMDIDN